MTDTRGIIKRNFSDNQVLVVDDEPHICDIISRILRSEGLECFVANNADSAMDILCQKCIDLVISDINMPGRSGLELLEAIKAKHPLTAVIMVTAVDDRETAIYSLKHGAYGYIIKPFDRNELIINVANALERRELYIASREYEIRLEKEVLERTADVRRREEEIAIRLVLASKYRDEETGAHILRLGAYSALLAKTLGWTTEDVDSIRIAASMHDMGKIGIEDKILRKPGKLTPEEFEIIKTHTTIGAALLEGSDVCLLQLASSIAKSHHEKWDGSGYPEGLRGEDIPEAAMIVAVADVYDALVNDRVYRTALPEEKAIEIMRNGRDAHFSPIVFDCFMDVRRDFQTVLQQFADNNKLFAMPYKIKTLKNI